MENISFIVKGMTCMGCVASVKKVLEPLPGVAGVEIALENGLVAVAFDPASTEPDQLKNAINDAGYEVAGEG